MRQMQRGGIQVKERAQIHKGKTKRGGCRGKRKSQAADMMDRGRVRENLSPVNGFPSCCGGRLSTQRETKKNVEEYEG